MPTPPDKQQLFELLYEARTCPMDEKAAAWDRFHAAADRVRAGTPYSRGQLKDLLYQDGYFEYAKRQKLAERPML